MATQQLKPLKHRVRGSLLIPYVDVVFGTFDLRNLLAGGLNGKQFNWQDYGGPLALLRLSEFIRVKMLGDLGKSGSSREAESVMPQSTEYLQPGHLILRRLEETP